jgi:hypothetical protein
MRMCIPDQRINRHYARALSHAFAATAHTRALNSDGQNEISEPLRICNGGIATVTRATLLRCHCEHL